MKSFGRTRGGFGDVYVIQEGDTVSSIAANLGDSVDDLRSSNSWLNNFDDNTSLAPVNDGGQYDGNDYSGQMLTFSPPAVTLNPAPSSQPSSGGIFASVGNVFSNLIKGVTTPAAQAAMLPGAAPLTVNRPIVKTPNWALIGIGAVVIVGLGFAALVVNEK